MTALKPKFSKLSDWVLLGAGVLVGLPILLLAAFLVVFAPFPQLAIHVQWCWQHLGLLGLVILMIGLFGVVAAIMGRLHRKSVLIHIGMLSLILPVIGVAIHREIVTRDWQDISLLGAFLFSDLLIYGVLWVIALEDAPETPSNAVIIKH